MRAKWKRADSTRLTLCVCVRFFVCVWSHAQVTQAALAHAATFVHRLRSAPQPPAVSSLLTVIDLALLAVLLRGALLVIFPCSTRLLSCTAGVAAGIGYFMRDHFVHRLVPTPSVPLSGAGACYWGAEREQESAQMEEERQSMLVHSGSRSPSPSPSSAEHGPNADAMLDASVCAPSGAPLFLTDRETRMRALVCALSFILLLLLLLVAASALDLRLALLASLHRCATISFALRRLLPLIVCTLLSAHYSLSRCASLAPLPHALVAAITRAGALLAVGWLTAATESLDVPLTQLIAGVASVVVAIAAAHWPWRPSTPSATRRRIMLVRMAAVMLACLILLHTADANWNGDDDNNNADDSVQTAAPHLSVCDDWLHAPLAHSPCVRLINLSACVPVDWFNQDDDHGQTMDVSNPALLPVWIADAVTGDRQPGYAMIVRTMVRLKA